MGTIAAERPPIRLVTRGLAELQTSIMAEAIPLFGGSIDRFAIFTLLLGQAMRAEPGEDRPTSILAIASSLSRPFETVRRNVHRLVDEGLCALSRPGASIAPGVLERPDIARLTAHTHDCLVRFIAGLRAAEAIPPLAPAATPYRPAVAVLAASDLMLAVADNNTGTHETFADLVIFSAVLAHNYRTVTVSPTLSCAIRNETHPTPADLIRSVGPSTIARALGLPETTVRRRMIAMLAGPLASDGRRYVVSEAWLNRAHAIEVSRATCHRVRRTVGELAQAGFPIDRPERMYLAGTAPAYVAFDR